LSASPLKHLLHVLQMLVISSLALSGQRAGWFLN